MNTNYILLFSSWQYFTWNALLRSQHSAVSLHQQFISTENEIINKKLGQFEENTAKNDFISEPSVQKHLSKSKNHLPNWAHDQNTFLAQKY